LGCLVSSAAATASKYRWRKGSVTVSVSTSLTSHASNIAASADVSGAIDRSILSWQQVAAITVRRVSSTEQNVSPAGNQGDGVSLITVAGTQENAALFPKGLEDATARTRVFYDARGYITEADIVLNPFLQFSTDGTTGTFDLESTLTHELGHLLGLTHSPVIGATMNDNYGRNGVYNLPAFSARTLSSDDIASIRSLYGPAEPSEDCCGRVGGRLLFNGGKPAANYTVWAEDTEDGHVVAASISAVDGSFRMGGLPTGRLRIWAQNNDSDMPSPATDLGNVNVTTKEPTILLKKIERSTIDSFINYLGFNGQIAEIAVPVNSGSSYWILAGSTNVGENWNIESSSNLMAITSQTFAGNFADHIRAVGFDVSVASNAPEGEYSLSLRNSSGERRFLIGGITVERFQNLWSTTNFR
jgi:hypothetical protein